MVATVCFLSMLAGRETPAQTSGFQQETGRIGGIGYARC